MSKKHFTPALFRFFQDLKQNNDREWFQANKERYERDVREPMTQFVLDFGKPLAKISAAFVADPRPVGGSIFRIYRDTRFAKDKTPYKTAGGIHFRHTRAKDAHTPGFYLHLEPGGVFAGSGIWRPDTKSQLAIRQAIVDEPDRWKRLQRAKAFRDRFELAGDSLKRPPRGFDPEHPLIEDLKRKDFITVSSFTQRDVCSAGFLEDFAGSCRASAPFVRFLTEALDLEW